MFIIAKYFIFAVLNFLNLFKAAFKRIRQRLNAFFLRFRYRFIQVFTRFLQGFYKVLYNARSGSLAC